jgi:hypothetical protein
MRKKCINPTIHIGMLSDVDEKAEINSVYAEATEIYSGLLHGVALIGQQKLRRDAFASDDLPPFMRLFAVLNTLNPILHAQSDFTGLLALFEATVYQLSLIADLPHRTDDGRGASPKDFD